MRSVDQSNQRGVGRVPLSPPMTRGEFMAQLEVQRKKIDDAISRMQKDFAHELKNTNDKLNEIVRSLEFSQRSWEEKEQLIIQLKEKIRNNEHNYATKHETRKK